MEVKGKIIVKLPQVSGTSKSGNAWSKQEYVLETQETYPKKIFFSFFGERANQYPLEVGQTVNLSFDIDSHEYNGRWFTNINGWKAELVNETAPAQDGQVPPADNAPFAPDPAVFNPQTEAGASSTDDLPF